jgi:2-oxoglutarate ferredoxin oxidoreductase subunit alpha
MHEFINGAEAIARGALDAGCTFFAGYPITPATPILLHMVNELPKVGGVAIQAEDEIAAMGFCIGAAMAGARVMTATSGPGISLYSENTGLAIMGEVPMVIVDCQRMGPATGGATTVAQGDTQFLRWGTSGGYPVIVLCPANVPDCYALTRTGFDLAERFRAPVFIATDKEMVSTNVTVRTEAFAGGPAKARKTASAEGEFIPYRVEEAGEVTPMSPFGGPHLVRFTASSHNQHGYLTKDPREVGFLNEHLSAKIEAHLDEISQVRADLQEGADTLLVGYGISAQGTEALPRAARGKGIKVSALTLLTLWPVPEESIREALEGIQRVVVAELNSGQYRREIERLAQNHQEVIEVNRVDGELITPEEILEKGRLV